MDPACTASVGTGQQFPTKAITGLRAAPRSSKHRQVTKTLPTLPSPCPLPLELKSEARYLRNRLTLLYTKKMVMPMRARARRAPITIPISWVRSQTEHPSARLPQSPSPPWQQAGTRGPRAARSATSHKSQGPPITRKHLRWLPWWTVNAAPSTAAPRTAGQHPDRSQPRGEQCGQEGPTQAWP